MKVLNSILDIDETLKIGLTIGNFDGVHLGHQEFLNQIKETCSNKNEELVLMTFIPHPLVILKNKKNFLINSYEERRGLLMSFGVKNILEVEFDRDLSVLNPGEFLEKYIFVHKNISSLYLGHDFAFGANKKGDHDFVRNFCKKMKVSVQIQEKVEKDELLYSSSLVRDLVCRGETYRSKNILGRSFFISGNVIKGAGRGKQLGFPTANILFDDKRLVPSNGVYATFCELRNCRYESITNIGFNPTFSDEKLTNVETHIFDFNDNLYGENIKIIFDKKIRDEVKFSSVNDLIKQINDDIQKRKDFLD